MIVSLSSKITSLLTVLSLLSCVTTMGDNTVKVIKGQQDFALKLYDTLAKGEQNNLIVSPISVNIALSMLHQGAEGSTKDLITSVLKISPNEAAEGYKEIIANLNNVKGVDLQVANNVFVHKRSALLESYKNVMIKTYLSELKSLNFGDSAGSAGEINKWVEEKTKNKIRNLISPNDLNDDTRVVLVNAIYFKGNWQRQFDPKNTSKKPFYLNDGGKVDVDMMFLKNSFRYKVDEKLGAQILEMPYENSNFSMVFILPQKKNGLAEVEAKLANYDLSELFYNTYVTEVEVYLPKFKFEKTIDLQDPLVQMGLGEIFDPQRANLKGMIEGNEDLYVSKAIQKAIIEVNEEGATAAAATGFTVRMKRSMEVRIPVTFTADHPFTFFLISKPQLGDQNQEKSHLIQTLFRGSILQLKESTATRHEEL